MEQVLNQEPGLTKRYIEKREELLDFCLTEPDDSPIAKVSKTRKTATPNPCCPVSPSVSGQPRFPAYSNAVKTRLFKVCKRCGQVNSNGYQYCSACHKAHSQK